MYCRAFRPFCWSSEEGFIKRFLVGVIFCLLAISANGAVVTSQFTIDVVPWLAPNVFGSPSFGAAEANAVQGIYAGAATYGPAGPEQFNKTTGPVSTAEVVVTGFTSWRGQIDPGTNFGTAYANELGNRMTFGVRIEGHNGAQFSIGQMAFSATSTDPFNALAFGFNAGAYNYGAGYIGILYGTDGMFGGGDDTFITSGPNNQLVDALVGRGSGNSFAAYCSGICDQIDQQAALDAVAAYPGTPFEFTGTYRLMAGTQVLAVGEGTFEIGNNVPEPGSHPLFGAAFLGIAGLRIMKRKS